jgi:hypothetical protein
MEPWQIQPPLLYFPSLQPFTSFMITSLSHIPLEESWSLIIHLGFPLLQVLKTSWKYSTCRFARIVVQKRYVWHDRFGLESKWPPRGFSPSDHLSQSVCMAFWARLGSN